MLGRGIRLPAALIIGATALATGGFAATAATAAGGPKVTTITVEVPAPYTPKAPSGGTDDYHCTLINPHLTQNVFIISSLFLPESPEVHHEITYLVPPAYVADAEAVNDNGKGWTCFGGSGITGGSGAIGELAGAAPWLTAWAPGHGEDVEPAGTGTPFPAGSMIVLQEHYNLLVGDKPVQSKLELNTVPATTPLRPLSLQPMAAPPDIPCPTGATGPMCSRSAELASVGKRFGSAQEQMVDGLEWICGRSASDPPVGDTTSCTWPVRRPGNVVRLGVHMHLLGTGMKIVLNPGTSTQQTLLDVTDYNFHDQKAYNLAKPVPVTRGDTISVTCTYNPQLELELPILRKVPPHFVTWGDGSTDEMCLGLIITDPPNSEPESVALDQAFNRWA
jgi:hypothetical protein